MRKLIVTEFVTLDGVMEAPGGEETHAHTGWVADFPDEAQEQWKFQEVLAAEAHLLGRVTYESFAGAWPSYDGPFADRMNSMKKYVVSSTLSSPEWDNTEVLPDLEAVRRLKVTDGGDLLVAGSGTLVHGLLQAELVDELRLMVFPVTIGGGFRVFPETDAETTFTLRATETFRTGVVVNTYVVKG